MTTTCELRVQQTYAEIRQAVVTAATFRLKSVMGVENAEIEAQYIATYVVNQLDVEEPS